MSEETPAYTTKTAVYFRAGPVLADLTARVTPGSTIGATARRDLARYYEILKAEALERFPAAGVSLLNVPPSQIERRLAIFINDMPDSSEATFIAVLDALERAQLLIAAGTARSDALREVGLVR